MKMDKMAFKIYWGCISKPNPAIDLIHSMKRMCINVPMKGSKIQNHMFSEFNTFFNIYTEVKSREKERIYSPEGKVDKLPIIYPDIKEKINPFQKSV